MPALSPRGAQAPARFFAFIFAAAALTGCAGARFRAPDDPLILLGDGAACYIAAPVSQNRFLFDAAADSTKRLDAKERSSVDSILDRSDIVRAAVFPDQSAALVLTGDFPRAAASFAFPESKGWKRVRGNSGHTWYASGTVSAAIPANGIVCVTFGADMEAMLSRGAGDPFPPVSEALRAVSTVPAGSDIAFSVVRPELFVPLVLGAEINLPVSRIDGVARPSDAGGTYALDIDFQAVDASRARALSTLLRLVTGIPAEVAGNSALLKTSSTSAETLAGFASFLLF